MLKIKHSTAKMMIRNYKECDVQDLADQLRKTYKEKKPKGGAEAKNKKIKKEERPKKEEDGNFVYFLVYFQIDPSNFDPPAPNQ